MASGSFSFIVRTARNAVRHAAGWEVESVDRHRIEYRDGSDVARVGIEDVVGGVVLYAWTVDWVATSASVENANVLARCALALQAMAWGDVSVKWGEPRWGITGDDEAYSFAGQCVVRLSRERQVAEYEDAAVCTTVPLERTTIGDNEGTAWMLRRDSQLDVGVFDRIVDGLLYLTGEPVQVRSEE